MGFLRCRRGGCEVEVGCGGDAGGARERATTTLIGASAVYSVTRTPDTVKAGDSEARVRRAQMSGR
jgi:hypothetical protein